MTKDEIRKTKNESALTSLRKTKNRSGEAAISSEPTLEARAETKLVWAMPCEEEEKMQAS